MTYVDEKSAQIEREIEQDRRRIEDKIGAIQDKLSPGQLVDEALAYAKGHGGTEFASNLKSSAVANPIPVALIGIGLVWLMSKPSVSATPGQASQSKPVEYPLAPVTGEVRRSRSAVLDGDNRYSHFTDGAGKSFRALADETGRRAGHFIDDAGNTFRGFADASGQQIDRLLDETGNVVDEASGWAQRAWSAVTETVADVGKQVSGGGQSFGKGASSAFQSAQDQSGRFNDLIQGAFRDQPLVGGALAFAFGAAIGAALPRTDQEDALMGDAAAKVKDTLKVEADKAMEKGSDIASKALDAAVDVASDVRDVARDRIGEGLDKIAEAATAVDGEAQRL